MKELGEKKIAYSEHAYFFSVLFIALSVAFLYVAGFGTSLTSAPALVLYQKVAYTTDSLSYGEAEYTIQALVLLFLFIVTGRFNKKYVMSFVSTLLFSAIIDATINVFALIPYSILGLIWVRVIILVFALVLGPFGFVLMSHTYISPIIYILYQDELSDAIGKSKNTVFWTYSLVSCGFALFLSFYFFGMWEFIGVNIGTILYTLSTILLHEPMEHFVEKHYKFRDKYPKLKRHFR